MTTRFQATTTFVICGVVTLAALGGCAKRNDPFPSSRSRKAAMEESTFAAGAGRAPTAATSYSFAKILVGQGRDRDALYVLSRIIRDHPNYLPAYNEMAGVYVRADRLDDAVTVLTTGLEQSPKDAVLQNNLGMCLLLQEDHAGALEAFTCASESSPTNPTFRSNRAAALALSGRDAEAEAEYQTVLGKLQTRQNLSLLARARGSHDEPETRQPTMPTESAAPAEVSAQPPAELAAEPTAEPTAEQAVEPAAEEAVEPPAAAETVDQADPAVESDVPFEPAEEPQTLRIYVPFDVMADLESGGQPDAATVPQALSVIAEEGELSE